jgi:hypothetical protein
MAGDAELGQAVRAALSHGRRRGLGLTVEAECGRWVKEAVIYYTNEERLGDVGEHRANAGGIGDVAR